MRGAYAVCHLLLPSSKPTLQGLLVVLEHFSLASLMLIFVSRWQWWTLELIPESFSSGSCITRCVQGTRWSTQLASQRQDPWEPWLPSKHLPYEVP